MGVDDRCATDVGRDDTDDDCVYSSAPILLTPKRVALIKAMAARATPLSVKRVAH
jgi:hypothetical protein